MTSPSTLIPTTIAVVTSLSTSFSTIYHTSTPILLSTITSIASQYSTLIQTASLTQPEIIVTSTLAFPVTLTQSIPQVVSSIEPPLVMSTIAVTETITSTIIDTRPTITIDLLPWPPLTPTTITTTATETTIYPNAKTATLTQLDFVLEDTSGTAYTTFTTIISPNPSVTDAIVFTADGFAEQEHGNVDGWNSWSGSEKGGLIAGVVIAGLLIIGLIVMCLMRRRRSIWVASDYVGPPQRQIQAPYAYWGPGPSGWGIRGGGDVK